MVPPSSTRRRDPRPAEVGVLRPGTSAARGTRQSLTERVAASFAAVAQALRERGHDPQAVAHFVNRLVFCMFADDGRGLRDDDPRVPRSSPRAIAQALDAPVGLVRQVLDAAVAAERQRDAGQGPWA